MYETTTAPKSVVSVRAQGTAFKHPQDALIYLYGANEALWRWAGIVHGAAAESGSDIGNILGAGWSIHREAFCELVRCLAILQVHMQLHGLLM